jgi:hypothetical protein
MRWISVVRSVTLAFCCSACTILMADDMCKGGWQTKPAKAPGSKAVLKVSSTDRGEALEWGPAPSPGSGFVPGGVLEIHTAKGHVDQQGNVAICPSLYEASGNEFGQRMLLTDLKEQFKLPSGHYYAIKVTVRLSENERVTSGWVVAKIE